MKETIDLDVEEGICFECKKLIDPPRLYCCIECEEQILGEMGV